MIQNGKVQLSDLSVFSGLPVLENGGNNSGIRQSGAVRQAAIGLAFFLLAAFAWTDGLGAEDLVFGACLALAGLGFSLFVSKQ